MCHEKSRNIDKAIEQWENIYAVKKSFKDVAEKLSQFQELRENDSMKDFLTSSNKIFLDLCKNILEVMNLSISDQSLTKLGCQVIATEKTTGQWRNTKKMPWLINFYRITENIDQPQVREFHEELQNLKASRGIMVTSSVFTRAAKDFTESRPIELIDKAKLQELLDKAEKIKN